MIDLKLQIIIYGPGAKGDFLAGWLGTLPNYVDNTWCINPNTGRSTGKMMIFKKLGYPDTISDLLQPHRISLSASSDLIWACTNHGSPESMAAIQDLVDKDLAEIIYIDTSRTNPQDLLWNYFVKMYLSEEKFLHKLENNSVWYIDQFINQSNITNSHRINYLQTVLKQSLDYKLLTTYQVIPNSIVLDYNCTFVSGGSEYVNKKLKINISPRNQCHWDSMIALSESPNEIMVWGHCWKKADYFNQ